MYKTKRLAVFVIILSILMTGLMVPTTASADLEVPNPVAWYKFDGDGKDASNNGNNAAAVSPDGGKGITYVAGVDGKAAKFDGASYFEVQDSDSLELKKAYSYSVWIYKEDIRPKRYQPILEKRGVVDNESEIAYSLADSEDSETVVRFFDENEQSSNAYTNTYLDFHKWQLLTVTSDGQSVKYYVNGVLAANKQVANYIPESTGLLLIGNSEWDDNSFFKGVMDDLMIFNVTLTPTQIKNYYTRIANGTGKAMLDKGKKLVAHYKFEGNFKDASGLNHNGPDRQIQGITFVTGKLGKAAKFNGSGFIEVADSDLLDLGNNFSFSLWMYKEPMGESPDHPILYKSVSSIGEGKDPSYSLIESQGAAEVRLFDEHRQGNIVSSEAAVGMSQWYHFAVTCENNVMKFYYNGVLKGTKPFKGFVPNSSGKLFIGWSEWVNNQFFKGIMDDLRIYNYALSAAEVKKIADTTDKLAATPIKAEPLKAKASVQLKVTFTPLDTGKAVDVTQAAVYSTGNAKVAQVNKGKITAVAKGKTEITVKYGDGAHIIKIPVNVP